MSLDCQIFRFVMQNDLRDKDVILVLQADFIVRQNLDNFVPRHLLH